MKTDLELQLALAKMLPEVIRADYGTEGDDLHFEWLIEPRLMRVRSAEWLHIVWLIESGLELGHDGSEADDYQQMLYGIVNPERDFVEDFCNGADVEFLQKMLNASWQHRATALIALKGEK